MSLPLIPEQSLVLEYAPYYCQRYASYLNQTLIAKSLSCPPGQLPVLPALLHPNILPLHGLCAHADGRLTLLEASAPLGSLHARLHPAGLPAALFSPLRLCMVALGLARALAFAHAAGHTHCNLKSTNVLFTSYGVPLLCDFGLVARMRRAAMPADIAIRLGHPLPPSAYTAPEHQGEESLFTGAPPGDIYSLGILLCEMATGEALPALPAATEPRLRALIEPCLSQDPAARPTAAALIDSLQQLTAALLSEAVPFPLGGAQVPPPTAATPLTALLQLLRAGGAAAHTAQQVCAHLHTHASTAPGRDACLLAEAAPALVAVLLTHSANSTVALCACQALQVFVYNNPDAKEVCVEAGAAPALVAALYGSLQSAPAAVKVTALLHYMCLPAQAAFLAAGAVPALVATLRAHPTSEAVASAASLALEGLCTLFPAAQQACVAAGAVPLVALVISTFPGRSAGMAAQHCLRDWGMDNSVTQ